MMGRRPWAAAHALAQGWRRAGLMGHAPLFMAALALAAIALPVPHALAQEIGVTLSPIVVVDTEKLFAETTLGQQISADLQARIRDLAKENKRIARQLEAEEKALTEKRATLDPKEFRALADAFDAKVQRIRAEQDAKETALQRQRDAERQRFFERIAPFLTRAARKHEALVVLERRNVLFSASSIDITDETIAEVNAAVAQGTVAGQEAIRKADPANSAPGGAAGSASDGGANGASGTPADGSPQEGRPKAGEARPAP